MKYKIKKNIKNQNGQAALFIVFVIMFLLLFVGLFLADIALKQIKITRNIYQSVQAYYLADTGTEILLYKIRSTGEINPVSDSSPLISNQGVDLNGNSIDDGFFKVTREKDSPLELRIIGTYKDTARTVQLSW